MKIGMMEEDNVRKKTSMKLNKSWKLCLIYQ